MAETVGKIEVIIKGGKPWGFRLQSILENRSTITITEILPGGKADLHGKLKVGDNIIQINGIHCLSLEDALQLIDSAFRTLTILVWRGSKFSNAVSYGNPISKPFLSMQNCNGCAFLDSCNVESTPIYENLQDTSKFYPGQGLENSFRFPKNKNLLTTLLNHSSSSSMIVRTHVRESSHFSSSASSNSCIPNSNMKWKKQSFTQKAGIKSDQEFRTQFNSINERGNVKESKSSDIESDSIRGDTQSINQQMKKNSLSTWNKKTACVYPNCQNASQACTKHSPPERDFVKQNFKQKILNEPDQNSVKASNEKLPSLTFNLNRNQTATQFCKDSSSMKGSGNSPLTSSKPGSCAVNIYSNNGCFNSFSQNNLNEDNCQAFDKVHCRTVSQLPDADNTSPSRNIKDSSFSNSYSSNSNLLPTNMMNELNQKRLYTNQIYSNVTYSNLKSNIQPRKNNLSHISFQNTTNKENFDLISASHISDNIKVATKNVDEKILNKETNSCIDRGVSSYIPSFSQCAKLKNFLTGDMAVIEKCSQKDNLVNLKKIKPVVSRYENIPIEFQSVSNCSEVKASINERTTNSAAGFSDRLNEREFFGIHSYPFKICLVNPQNKDEIASNQDDQALILSNPNYENITYVSSSNSDTSVTDVQQDKSLVECETASFDSPKSNFMDNTLYSICNKSSISTSVFKYSTICSKNNQNMLDKDLPMLNIYNCPETSVVMGGRITPPLPSPPPKTEAEIFESNEPLPPPPFPHDFDNELQNDSQVVQAVYANIEMLKVQCSLVSSATQTTLLRKDNSRKRDGPNLKLASQQSISLEEQVSVSQKKDCKVSTRAQNYQKPKKCSLNLPLTSPYFTTSVPKAKLLTQHTSKFEERNFHIDKELSSEKEVLIDSIARKLQILKHGKDAIEEELKQNEELGLSLATKLENLATDSETRKFKLYVEELEKITNLLLSLSGRIAKTENALFVLPTESSEEKEVLQDKYKKLRQQYDEAVHLQDNIEKRNKNVSVFLCKYFNRDDLIDYDHFVHMKVKLLVDYKDLIEKIKLGEEQLYTLKTSFNAYDCNEFKSTVK